MFTSSHGAPQGYNYPEPRSPGDIEGDYDDYDPEDVPQSQARPGYSYPVPANPLVLPERVRGGKRVEEEEDSSHLVVLGLRHQQFDSYDPADYEHNDQDYLDFSLNLLDSQPQQGFLTKPRSFSESSRSREIPSVDGQVIHSGISRQPKSVDPDSVSKVNNKKSNLPSRATLAVQQWLKRGRK